MDAAVPATAGSALRAVLPGRTGSSLLESLLAAHPNDLASLVENWTEVRGAVARSVHAPFLAGVDTAGAVHGIAS